MYSASIMLTFGDKEKAELKAVIQDLGKMLDDFRPLWKGLRPIIAQAFARNFATESSISGVWPKLTPEYLKRKLKQGFPENILVRTGELIRACTQIGETSGPNQIMIDTEFRFAFGVTLDYSWYHDREQGSFGKRREHLALDEQALAEVEEFIATWTFEEAGRIWSTKAGGGHPYANTGYGPMEGY